MFKIEGPNMYITKGDSATITVQLLKTDGTVMTLPSGSSAVFTAKSTTESGSPALSVPKTLASSAKSIDLTITASASAGSYCADIQVTADGKQYTIWPQFSASSDIRCMTGEKTEWANLVIVPSIGG